MRISEIASSAEYRIDEQFQNPDLKNSRNLLIFQFGIFQKFAIQKIRKICDFKNSETFPLEKFHKFSI